jgi:hypothetical protein
MTYHLGPPIRDDASYYRDDLDSILACLRNLAAGAAQGVLVLGLARSGKTSTLWRLARLVAGGEETRLSGSGVRWPVPRPTELMDLRDWGERAAPGDTPARHVARALDAAPNGLLLLLDELDAVLDPEQWPPERSHQLVRALREGRDRLWLVAAASPVIEACEAEAWRPWRDFAEELAPLAVRPLTDAEAQALVEQRRGRDALLEPAAVARVLAKRSRLPLPLQALAHAELHAASPLLPYDYAGGVFRRLSAPQQDALRAVTAGRGATDGPHGAALARLEELGALRRHAGGWQVADPFLAESLGAGGSVAIPPPAAPESATWSEQASVLHLSDLHFDPENVRQFRGLEPDTLARSLIEALAEFDGTGGQPRFPDLVAVSGDLSWSAHPAEFDLALRFLGQLSFGLARQWRIAEPEARQRFVIVPGNHDASWQLSDGLLEGRPEVARALEPWLPFALAPFADAYREFYRGARQLSFRSPLAVYDFPERDLLVLGLSSCHGLHRKQRDGCLDPEALGRLVGAALPPRALRLAVFHHNVEPVNRVGDPNRIETDYLHNGNAVLPSLGVAACLHGHTHLPVPGKPARCGVVCFGAGSFGVNAAHLPGNEHLGRVPRQFNTIVFERSSTGRRRARLWTRQCVPDVTGHYVWQKGSEHGKEIALCDTASIVPRNP